MGGFKLGAEELESRRDPNEIARRIDIVVKNLCLRNGK